MDMQIKTEKNRNNNRVNAGEDWKLRKKTVNIRVIFTDVKLGITHTKTKMSIKNTVYSVNNMIEFQENF